MRCPAPNSSPLSATFATDTRSARIVVIENGVIDAWLGVPLDQVIDALQTRSRASAPRAACRC